MAHDKVYGVCENKCFVEVPTKEQFDELKRYSTEEIRVGTWIDGRPIYRKVVELNKSRISTLGDGLFYYDDNDNSLGLRDVSLIIKGLIVNEKERDFSSTTEYFSTDLVYKNDVGRDSKQFMFINSAFNFSVDSESKYYFILEYVKKVQ